VPQTARVFLSADFALLFGVESVFPRPARGLQRADVLGVPKMEFRWIVFLVLWTLLTGPIMARPSLVTSHASAKATKAR